MSETVTFDPNPEPQRARKPPERQERVMTEEQPVAEIGEVAAEPTPEEALADAKRIIESRDQALALEQQQRQAAENAARQAAEQARQAASARHQDRAAVAASAVEAAKADKQRAQQALRLARDAGDFDAEAKALDDMSGASYRLHSAEAELAGYRQQQPEARSQDASQQPSQQPQIHPNSQAWLDRNPRFFTDKTYQEALIAESNRLLRDGLMDGSPAYLRAIEAKSQELIDGGSSRLSPSSSGAPPSRGGSQASGGPGGSRVDTLLGPVNFTRLSDGRVRLAFPPGVRENFEEGARIAGMTLAEYAYEQVLVARERQAGGTGGLIVGDGKDHR